MSFTLRSTVGAAFLAAALSACGHADTNDASLASVRGGKLATLRGIATIQLWHCGGAALPPPPAGPCSSVDPISTTFAVARVVDASGRLELAAWVKSDAAGRYDVRVPAGRYEIVSKATITNDPADALGINATYVAPFTLRAGEVATRDFTIQTPPPPITIGVGN